MPRSKQADEIFCPSCGSAIKKRAEICPECGVRNSENPANAGNQSAEQSGEHDPDQYTTTNSENWKYAVAASVGLWIMALSIPGGWFIEDPLILVAWALMPFAVYMDYEVVRATTKWNPDRSTWVILSLIPIVNIFAGAIYVAKRFNADTVSSRDGKTTDAQLPNDTGDDAVTRLKERYAAGELTDEEFERRLEKVVGVEEAAKYTRETTEQQHVESQRR